MSLNLYWSVYRNLEKELLELASLIHIDDNQLNVYSMKIAELLIRVCVECESIAKELYIQQGGSKPDNKDLYFDTDCMQFLHKKWKLDLKKVQLISVNFYLENEENKIFQPLKKAHKRGTSSEKWLQAYQAVKHSRRTSLKQANLKNLIHAMAGLYLLNIYLKNNIVNLGSDNNGTTFDNSCGSEIFAIFVHGHDGSINLEMEFSKNENFNECVYFILPEENTAFPIREKLIEINNNLKEKVTIENVIERLERKVQSDSLNELSGNIKNRIENEMKVITSEMSNDIIHQHTIPLSDLFKNLEFQAVLNMNQF